MSEHSPLPWEKFGMGDIMSKGQDGYYWFVKTNYEHAPPSHIAEREANLALILKAVNNHEALVKALEEIARQMTTEENLAEHGEDSNPDYEGGYDAIIKVARDALASVGRPLTSPEGA